jgi:hypothetical protein
LSSKTFTGADKMFRNISEENAKIRPPRKNYDEINANDTVEDDKNRYYNKSQPKKENNEDKNTNSSDQVQKPLFVNSNLENKSNFKELETKGDVSYIKLLLCSCS